MHGNNGNPLWEGSNNHFHTIIIFRVQFSNLQKCVMCCCNVVMKLLTWHMHIGISVELATRSKNAKKKKSQHTGAATASKKSSGPY